MPYICPPLFQRLYMSCPISATLPQPFQEGILSGFDIVWVTLTRWQDGMFLLPWLVALSVDLGFIFEK